jgi:hypothetical protein
MSDTAFHYTKVVNLSGILRDMTLLPSPPLARYGFSREAVEADPGSYGFRVLRQHGRRYFLNDHIPDRNFPHGRADWPQEWLSVAGWHEGQRFDVSFSRAGWCASTLGYMPPGMADAGYAWRLVIDLSGLDVFTWQQYQTCTNVPGRYRRQLGELSRKQGDETADWLFVLGPVPLGGRLLGLEQYHQGRWTGFDEVAQRLPLEEMFQGPPGRDRPRFRSQFILASAASAGRVGTSLFGMVFV